MEEVEHIKSRYDNNRSRLFHEVFAMSLLSCTTSVLSLFILFIICFILNENPVTVIFQENKFSVLVVFISMILLRRVLKLVSLKNPMNL